MNLVAAVGLVLLALMPPAWAEAIAPPPSAPADAGLAPAVALPVAHDVFNRMTVPVMIDGKGPFDFVVDTGADRTVISRELAAGLHLPPGPSVVLNSSSGAAATSTAAVATLAVGARQIGPLNAAILPRDFVGAAGMLGVDAVRDQAMVLDFVAHRMTVLPLAPDQDDPRAIVVSGRNRYGQMILLDASVQGEPVFVILDTGAQVSVVNSTFLHDFAGGEGGVDPVSGVKVLSVIGGVTPGAFATLPELTLGDLTLQNLPVVHADLYTFRLFRLDHRPAMLLGMNVLRNFDRVAIDYRHRSVRFTLARSAIAQTAFDHFSEQGMSR